MSNKNLNVDVLALIAELEQMEKVSKHKHSTEPDKFNSAFHYGKAEGYSHAVARLKTVIEKHQ